MPPTTPPNPPNGPVPETNRVHEIIRHAGEVIKLTGLVGAPYVSAGVAAAKLIADLINRHRAPGVLPVVIDKEAIQMFIDTAKLGRAEGQAILDRWAAEEEASGVDEDDQA